MSEQTSTIPITSADVVNAVDSDFVDELVRRWNGHDALLDACEEGHKRISFLLDKIIKAEAFPEVVILERVEIDKTESCIKYAKAAIAETKKKGKEYRK